MCDPVTGLTAPSVSSADRVPGNLGCRSAAQWGGGERYLARGGQLIRRFRGIVPLYVRRHGEYRGNVATEKASWVCKSKFFWNWNRSKLK